jgi:nicotinate-nucleotide pyrophosphorylase (carboxylating)
MDKQAQLNLEYLIPPTFRDQVARWLAEDIPSFDYSSCVVGDRAETALLYMKTEGVLAGVPFFNMVFELVHCKVEWHGVEGTYFAPDESQGRAGYLTLATVTGLAKDILMGERLALNILATASGIALKSHRLNQIALANRSTFHGKVAATRKVTPGFRLVQKYAVLVGGCDAHRMDLSSMIMLKDNAIDSCGSITLAVQKAKKLGGFSLKIEVECRSLEDAIEAGNADADVIMLDNFSPANALEVSAQIKNQFPHILIEVSGGITEDSAASYMGPHIDILSTSSLIQGVPVVDFSLKIQRRH